MKICFKKGITKIIALLFFVIVVVITTASCCGSNPGYPTNSELRRPYQTGELRSPALNSDEDIAPHR